MPALLTLATPPSADFALVDSGNGRKLERCGGWHFIRPEPQALWAPALESWQADGEFHGGADDEGGGRWQLAAGVPERWPIQQAGVSLYAECTPFRHFGFFPDMAPHWQRLAALPPGGEVLNLFGYTGVATLVAAKAGQRVVHVDASKKAVQKARRNAELSGLDEHPIRWIVDDARKFVAREVRRRHRYDAILLDPPKFGRGPDGEVWSLAADLPALLADCMRLLDSESRLLILTTYAVRLSALALLRLLGSLAADRPGRIEAGEMALLEEQRQQLLPTAIFARWEGAAGSAGQPPA